MKKSYNNLNKFVIKINDTIIESKDNNYLGYTMKRPLSSTKPVPEFEHTTLRFL